MPKKPPTSIISGWYYTVDPEPVTMDGMRFIRFHLFGRQLTPEEDFAIGEYLCSTVKGVHFYDLTFADSGCWCDNTYHLEVLRNVVLERVFRRLRESLEAAQCVERGELVS